MNDYEDSSFEFIARANYPKYKSANYENGLLVCILRILCRI